MAPHSHQLQQQQQQPLSSRTKKSPEDESVNVLLCHETKTTSITSNTTRPMKYACKSIVIFAAIAYSATCATAFSTGRNYITNRQISTPDPIYRPTTTATATAFIPNGRAGAASSSSTAIFATKRKKSTKSKTKVKSPKSDKDEWEALLAAFQMYKAAYGDLKVPSRFVVPSMPPWPESGWGLKLGQRVAGIRSTGKFVDGDDERRKILDDLGFLWRLRAPSPDKNMDVSFDQIYDALTTYRSEIQPTGTLTIPSNFIVPNYDPWPEATRGMPLGKKIPTVRSKAYLKANAGATERLNQIGFEFDGKVAANDARFNNVYNALVRYKEINGDLLVPQPFVVPDGSAEWAEEFYGLRLGARVNAIRSQGTFIKTNPGRREQLDQLGFEWELPSSGKKRGRKKKEEIEALAGPAPPGLLESSDVPAVDQEMAAEIAAEPVPVAAESPALSSAFNEIFQSGDQAQAPTWGFEDEEAEERAQLQQQAAEEEYKPPKNLNVTLEAAAQRAMDVGVIESLGQGKRVTKGSIHKVIPWFNDDFGDDFVFEDVVEALTFYKDAKDSFNDLSVDFVVPEPTFGAEFDIEASAEAAAAIANAESMGEDSDALIAAEIERMELEMKGESNPDEDSDEEEIKWPEHLAGMKLGSITQRIRDGSLEVKHLPDRKKMLDKIGFDWGDERQFLDVPFEKTMCALFGYYLVRGDLFVYEDYVMPGDKPWPAALAGFELGQAVKRIRELQNFFEAYHPEKVQLLRRVEFVWFPELALPLNPEEGPESWEDTFVEGMGHPFYQMNEPSVGTIERLIAAGPNGDESKTSSYYDYNEVGEFWERGDITDVGKESERPGWRPAEWLWFNGFDQLSSEHEERYGTSAGLDMMRLIEQYHSGEISEKQFDTEGKAAIIQWEEEQLKAEAISAGIEVTADDTMETIIERIKNDPECQAIDEDPEYKQLIEAEIDAEEARDRMIQKMDEEMESEEAAQVEEEQIDDEYEYEEEFEYEEEEEEDGAVKKKAPKTDEDDDDDVEFEDDDDDVEEEVEEEEEEDDFGIEEEEL